MFYHEQSHPVFCTLLSGSLSDGLGNITMDEHHEKRRQVIRRVLRGSSSDHIKAGLTNLCLGYTGGLTSIVKQPIQGACNDGLQVGHRLLVSVQLFLLTTY
jgi:hypothetical protein